MSLPPEYDVTIPRPTYHALCGPSDCVDELHAAFRNESRTRGCCLVPRTGNPGISLLRCGNKQVSTEGL